MSGIEEVERALGVTRALKRLRYVQFHIEPRLSKPEQKALQEAVDWVIRALGVSYGDL